MARRPRSSATRRRTTLPKARSTTTEPRRRRPRRRASSADGIKKVDHRVWPGKLIKHERGECRWCGSIILRADGSRNNRRTFCGWRCVDEYLLRVEPKRMRLHVFERDEGFCQGCGVGFDNYWDKGWEADHVVPLWFAHATGDWSAWDAQNVRLLCVACHKIKTSNDRIKYAWFRKQQALLRVA